MAWGNLQVVRLAGGTSHETLGPWCGPLCCASFLTLRRAHTLQGILIPVMPCPCASSPLPCPCAVAVLMQVPSREERRAAVRALRQTAFGLQDGARGVHELDTSDPGEGWEDGETQGKACRMDRRSG